MSIDTERSCKLFKGKDVFDKYYDYMKIQLETYTNPSHYIVNVDTSSLIPVFLGTGTEDQYKILCNDYIKLMLEVSLQEQIREKQTDLYNICEYFKKKISLDISINPLARLVDISPALFYQEFYKIKGHIQLGNPCTLIGQDLLYLEVLRIRIAAEIYQSMGLEW